MVKANVDSLIDFTGAHLLRTFHVPKPIAGILRPSLRCTFLNGILSSFFYAEMRRNVKDKRLRAYSNIGALRLSTPAMRVTIVPVRN